MVDNTGTFNIPNTFLRLSTWLHLQKWLCVSKILVTYASNGCVGQETVLLALWHMGEKLQ